MKSNIEKPKYITDDKDFVPKNLVVNALIYDDNGRILLLKRKSDHTYYPDYWSVIMEKVKEGEDFAHALSRGIEEELGFQIQNDNVSVMPKDLKKEWKDEKYLIRRYFVNIGDKEIALNHEHDVSMWLSQDFLADIDIMPDSKEMIEEFWRS